MYDIAAYTRVNIEETANSQIRLDANSDYNIILLVVCNFALSLVHKLRPMALIKIKSSS